jgi:SAM-dependent methyltransferase
VGLVRAAGAELRLTGRLAQRYEVERAKWDAVAEAEAGAATMLPPYSDFGDYVRRHRDLDGVAEFLGNLEGKHVLEFGCGLGKATALLVKSGANVCAFDISPRSVEVATQRLEANGLHADIAVAAGEDIPYPDESFDRVFGAAILHHLDVESGRRELYRVLKPGGKAAFVEPLGTNPIVRFVRNYVPYRHKTPRGADVPLRYADIEAWGRGFQEFRYREIQLLSMVQRLFGFEQRFDGLHRLDHWLLRRAPALRRFCRYVVIYAVK